MVTLSQVGGVGLLDTINIANASVTLGGVAGVSALVAYNIGSGGTLRLQSTVGVSAGTTIGFTAPNSHLIINSGVNLNLLGGIAGFGIGSNIDVAVGSVSFSYSDNVGTGTGGTLTLLDGSGISVGTVALSTGEFTASSFFVHADGTGGTLIDFATRVSSVTATPGTGNLTVGGAVTLQLGTTVPVTVLGGLPTLTLSDGGVATYDAANSTATNLVFRHTVQVGQNTADLSVTGTNLNGATIIDVLGNALDLSGAVGNPTGILQIDTIAPTVDAVATLPGSGALGAGQVVAINVTPSEAVTVTNGVPTLTLSDGGTATYDAAASTATSLKFKHTVQAGQNTADLAVTGASLNGATIADGAGNALNLSGTIGNPAGILQIDTIAPMIATVAMFPGSGSLRVGQIVTVNVTASEAVTLVGGIPSLTLNDGGTALYDAASSTSTNLVFRHTVQPGATSADLAITGTSLNGATIADGAGNLLSLSGAIGNPAGILQIDTTAPTIATVSMLPGSGSLAAGQIVTIAITSSEAVIVADGTPSLTLSDGGTAVYDAANSTSTTMLFKHTVQPGQNTADLAVTAVNLNGATISDPAGNAANLAGAIGNPVGILQIDTIAPTVTAIATVPGTASLGAGQIVTISVTPSEAVTVIGGLPTLTLSDGGTATYDAAGSTPTLMLFKHVIQPGQNTADLTITGTSLNGATIVDGAGNGIDLSGAVGNPAGILRIDTAAPTVAGVAMLPGSGSLTAGQVVTINVTPSEAVAILGGIPTLTLSDGGTATYDAANSTATLLVFKHTVQAGQNTADLAITGTSLNGATVADGAGNVLDLTASIGNPAGVLQIDTIDPIVASVAMLPGSGSFGAGQTVTIRVASSEAVTVIGGIPSLTLSDGGTAIYDADSSTPTTMVFKHTVQAGQNAADLAITGTSLNGATILDAAGNALNLSGAVGNPAGILRIDTTAPTIAATVMLPGSGSLGVGQTVTIGVTPSEAVTIVGGVPTLTLSDGGTATYDATSSTPTLMLFRHVVQPGQNTADLTITGTNLNGATISDGAGNALDFTGALGNPAGILQIDTTAPTISAIATLPGSGSLTAGQVVTISVTPSEAITVLGGVPTLTLSDGGIAVYDAVNSTPTSMLFSHLVLPGQNTADLTITGTSLNGAVISDAAGNAIALTAAIGNPAGILQIDTTAPTVISIATLPGSGSLTTGQTATIDVLPSEAVTVTGGIPTLILNDGGIATYDAANSTSTRLRFQHTVQVGETAADLMITGTSLNGAAITDTAGNAIDLSDAIGNPAGILQINTSGPVPTSIIAVATTPGSGDLTVGGGVILQVSTTDPVVLTGGIPTLTLNDGGTAIYDAASSTPTSLAFRYTVQAGQNTADLAVTGASLNGATIVDGLGGAVDLSGAIGNPAGLLQIDTIAPLVISIAGSSSSGALMAGMVATIEVATSEAVIVGGGGIPTLTLSDGGTAIYDASSSTPTLLVFKHTVQPGQNASALTIVGASMNRATISDSAGNALDLASAVGTLTGNLQVDTIAPTVAGVAIVPADGAFGADQIVTINVTPSEAVVITGGAPLLILDDGGTATYDAASSTPTLMVFKHVVQPGQNSDDLAIIGTSFNGATVADLAGNAIDLAAVIGNPVGTLRIDTMAPVLVDTTTSLGTGLLAGGQVVMITVTSSEPVTVIGGVPTLTLSGGGTAIYEAASSTPTAVSFRYLVLAGQNTADLEVTGVNPNGAAIADAAGNAFDLSGAIGNPAGVLQVDTTPPTVVGLATLPGNGWIGSGQTLTIDVSTSEGVTVSGGIPTLTLTDGSTAFYDAASSTPILLAFKRIVQPGESASNLAITSTDLNGAVIADAAGNAMDLSGIITSLPGVLQIDGSAPVVSTVVMLPGAGSLGAGRIVTINVNLNKAVMVVGGAPTLTLSDGGTATFDANGSTASMMAFTHIVQPGQNTADLAITGVSLNGATITDLAHNPLNLAGAVANPAGILRVDTTAPLVSAVTTLPVTGVVLAGQTLVIDVALSEAVTVAGGIPTLTLSDGGIATYDAANSTPVLMAFTHIVQPGQTTSDLTITGANLNSATITDAAGNALDLLGAIGNPPGILRIGPAPIAARVTGIATSPVDGVFGVGASILFNVSTSAAVTVANGAPSLLLNDGGTATYDASNSTPTQLAFRHTVQSGQNTADLAVSAVLLNGALLRDINGATLDLADAIANPNGILRINTRAPTVTALTTTPDAGSLVPGSLVTFTVAISDPITMTGGSPVLQLNDGGIATYDAANSTRTSMVFRHTIQAGQTAADLAVTGITLGGAQIVDAAGNKLDMSGAIGNPAGILQVGIASPTATITPKTIDVWRFFASATGTHFYTSNPAERDDILKNRPDLVAEGPDGVGLRAIDPESGDPNAVAVYRFFDLVHGTHFFTASTVERDSIIASRSDLSFEEASTFYEHAVVQPGDIPVYRFFDNVNGTHFYTDDPRENAAIIQTRPDLVSEGIGFYEPPKTSLV